MPSICSIGVWLFALAACLAGFSNCALARACEIPAYSLAQAERNQSLPFCYRLDPNGELSIETVMAQDEAFEAIDGERLSLGYTATVVWLKIPLRWEESAGYEWLLVFDYPLLDDIRLYEPGDGGLRERRLGDTLAFDTRLVHHREFLFPLMRAAGGVENLYVRLETTSSMQVHPRIERASDFFYTDGNRQIAYGLLYGVMLMMCLYNAFLYVAIRDPSYLAYVFSVLSGTLFIMALNGHAFQYLWPDSPALANTVVPLSSSLWMVGTAIFARLFLETDRYAPIFSRLLSGMTVLALGSSLLALFAGYRLAIEVGTALALVNGSLILLTSALCWIKGNRSARFFTLAWLVYGVGTGLLILSRFSVLPNNFITQNSAAMGLLAEIIILSLALSDKYRILHEELSKYSHDLEARVAERTEALEKANEFLHKMSRRDSLTGLANRLGFDEYLTQEWHRQRRADKEMALLFCDVDHFKGYNDSYGHRAGDLCLQAVASVISAILKRPADLGARYGGDELAVVLPETDTAGARKVAQRIVEGVRELDMEHCASPRHGQVTVSIGAASLNPNRARSEAELVEAADQALYRAKENGRNQAAVLETEISAQASAG